MEPRKIQLVGKRSYAVSLPKEWITRNNLKEKTVVYIEDLGDYLVLKANDKSIEKINNNNSFDLDKIERIKSFLVLLYMKGVDNIVLKSKKFNSKSISEIRNIISYLEGYSIVYEDEKNVEINFIFGDINLTIKKIIFRITYLIEVLFRSVVEKNEEMINETEQVIDRLYHLSNKILIACIGDKKKSTLNEINSKEDFLLLHMIVKKLETFADRIVDVKKFGFDDDEYKHISKLLSILKKSVEKKSNNFDLRKEINNLKNPFNDKAKVIIYRVLISSIRDIVENYILLYYNSTLEKQ